MRIKMKLLMLIGMLRKVFGDRDKCNGLTG